MGRNNNKLVTLYLASYNIAQAIGWAVALWRILLQASITNSVDGAFHVAGDLIRMLQLASLLEVVHGLIGIVPSGVLPTFLQWGGRYHWIAAIVFNVVEVQSLPFVFITFVAWSLSEVVRYPQYAMNTIGLCPQWLTWLRYSVFIPLYPIGALCGEVPLMYKALPFIKKLNLYEGLFNKLPFIYYNFVSVGIIVHPFLWLMLYIHMFKQRKSKLEKSRRTSGSKRSD